MSGYVAWKRVEPAKGQFVFNTKNQYGQTTANDLTNVLAAARDSGLKLILRIDEPPEWAGGAVHHISPADLENYLFEALRYARGFAPGTVEYVEVFNELNLPFEWGTSPVDPAAYARQLAGAYRGIKRADPSVRVVSAAMSQRTGGLFGTMEDVDWLEAFYRAGARDHFDVLGVHGYLGSFPAETRPECLPMCFRVIELYRAVMERHGDGGKRALVTEMGTVEQAPHDQGIYEWMELPPDRRGEYLVNALRIGNGNYPWFLGANLFNLDYATVPWNSPSGAPYWFSLLNPDRSPRPAYDRIRDARRSGLLP